MHCFCFGKYLREPSTYKTIKFTKQNEKETRELCREWADATNSQLTIKYIATLFALLMNNIASKLIAFFVEEQKAHTRSEESQ